MEVWLQDWPCRWEKLQRWDLAPAIFGPLMNVTGSVLANYWRGKPVNEDEEDKRQSTFAKASVDNESKKTKV